jgi:hypothetical protein
MSCASETRLASGESLRLVRLSQSGLRRLAREPRRNGHGRGRSPHESRFRCAAEEVLLMGVAISGVVKCWGLVHFPEITDLVAGYPPALKTTLS